MSFVFLMPQLCNCQVRWHLLEVPCRGAAQGQPEHGASGCHLWGGPGAEEQLKEGLSTVLAGVTCGVAWGSSRCCKALPVPAALRCFSDVSLGCQLRYLAERAANVGHLKPSMGSDSFWHLAQQVFLTTRQPKACPWLGCCPSFLAPNLSADLWLLRYFQYNS